MTSTEFGNTDKYRIRKRAGTYLTSSFLFSFKPHLGQCRNWPALHYIEFIIFKSPLDITGKTIMLFDPKARTIFQNEWWFSVEDVVCALTGSTDVGQYIKKMRKRDPGLEKNWGTICTPLEMIANDGKKRKIQAVNAEGIFRIIQSIPSPKAEPFKRWLAKVGYERVQEIEDPELAMKRMRAIYKAKGYPICPQYSHYPHNRMTKHSQLQYDTTLRISFF